LLPPKPKICLAPVKEQRKHSYKQHGSDSTKAGRGMHKQEGGHEVVR